MKAGEVRKARLKDPAQKTSGKVGSRKREIKDKCWLFNSVRILYSEKYELQMETINNYNNSTEL